MIRTAETKHKQMYLKMGEKNQRGNKIDTKRTTQENGTTGKDIRN